MWSIPETTCAFILMQYTACIQRKTDNFTSKYKGKNLEKYHILMIPLHIEDDVLILILIVNV